MSDSEEVTENENVRKRKRGVTNPDSYKQNVIKKCKLKGLEHVNYKGKTIIPRSTGPDCNCKKKCFQKFSDVDKISILKTVHDFETKTEQDVFLQGLITQVDVHRKRPRTDNPKSRACNALYNVFCDGKKEEVCKKAFLSLYGVTVKRVRRLFSLLVAGETPKECRGKNINSRTKAVPGEVIKKIHEHINSFPVKEARYANRNIKYLNAELTVKIMHSLFRSKYQDIKVTYGFYLKYFKENFGYAFGRPQKDVCATCEELGLKLRSNFLNDNAKRVVAAELLVHKNRSKKFYKKLNELKEKCAIRDDVACICFDYMQNLPLPHIPVQEVFYLRQLWVYVFCMYDVKKGTSEFHLYHEGIGNRGPNEVCTFLNYYITNNVPQTAKELHLFSDATGGQNRNNTVIRFLMTLVSSGRFQKVIQYYPIRGHSFLPCDRNFGVIKRHIKKFDRVYSPEEYAKMVVEASSACKFTSVLHEETFSTDFKNWWPQFYKKKVLSIESKGKKVPTNEKEVFSISKYYMFVCEKTNEGELRLKTYEFIDGLKTHTFKLQKSDDIPLPTDKAYEAKCPINPNKVEDVTKLKQYIPEEHIPFYDEICEWPTAERVEDE